MKEGHIRIARAIEEWRWGNDPTMVYFWLRILIMANWKDREWRDKVIKRGSFVTTIASLSAQLNLSVKQVRTCLDRLRAGGEVTTNTANNYTLVTICKYDSYQCLTANEGQMNGKSRDNERATTKEYKEYNTSDTNVSSYSIPKERREEKKKEKEEDTVVSSKKVRDEIDFDYIIEAWNANAKRSIPKVRALSQERKEKIKLRIAEMGGWEKAKETMAICFQKIGDSDFCSGANGKWAANIDWFFKNAQNWLKVLEGNYDNRQEKSQLEVLQENIARADAYYEQRYHGYGGASPYGNQTGGWPYGPDEQ